VAEDLPAKVVGQAPAAAGPPRAAIELTGEGFVEIGHDPRLDLARGGTLSAWICPQQQSPGGGRIIDKSAVGTSNGYLLDTHPGNSLRLITERGVLDYDARLKPGVWVHVAATVTPDGTLALYLDGKKVASKQEEFPAGLSQLDARVKRIRAFCEQLISAGLDDSYEVAHARLAVQYLATTLQRLDMFSRGVLERLPGPSQYAADKSYFGTVANLCDGLERRVNAYKDSDDARRRRVYEIWSGLEQEKK
jgi:hypothetical protein